MQMPRIHLNGTSKESLVKQYADCHEAVQKALDVVRRNPPHGRDYYVISGKAGNVAYREHQARVEALTKISDEFMALAMHCDEG